MVRRPTVPHLRRLDSLSTAVMFILLATILQLAHGLTIERPPQAPHVFNDTVESVEQLEVTLLAAENATIQHILETVSLENVTFDNTILPYVQNENIRLAKVLPIRVYDSGDLATTANEVYANVSNAVRAVFASEPYFALVDHLYQEKPALSEEDEIVLKDMWNKLATSGPECSTIVSLALTGMSPFQALNMFCRGLYLLLLVHLLAADIATA